MQAESEKEEAIAAAAKAAKAAAAAAAKKELVSPAPTLPAPRTAAADGRAPPRASDDDISPAAAPVASKDGADADAPLPALQPAGAAAPVAFARKKPRPKSNLSMLMSAGTFALPPPSQSAPHAAPAPSQQLHKAALPLVASTQQRGANKTKVRRCLAAANCAAST